MTGAVAFTALSGLFDVPTPSVELMALASLAAALVIKLGYWRHIDRAGPVATAESATGLGQFGQVRLLDGPHTGRNYVMREMGYMVARKHAQKLRGISLVTAFALPILFLGADRLIGIGAIAPIAAAILAGVGVAVERWLFFAEATHVAMTYYGQSE